jgi:flagellar biosynthesis/type III secretory pathway protein FliH
MTRFFKKLQRRIQCYLFVIGYKDGYRFGLREGYEAGHRKGYNDGHTAYIKRVWDTATQHYKH